MNKNLEKYFDSSLSSLFNKVVSKKEYRSAGNSFFRQPLSPSNGNQCLSEGIGTNFIKDLFRKHNGDNPKLDTKDIQNSIQYMQGQCGFMFATLAELLCNEKGVQEISDQGFFEKRLKHDPFDVDLENDDYFAIQSFYCSGSNKNKKQQNDDDVNCQNLGSFDSIEKLVSPMVSLKNYDHVISCNEQIFGSDDFLNEYVDVGINKDHKLNKPKFLTCSLINCSNVSQLMHSEQNNFKCEVRSNETQLLSSVVDLSKIKCTKEENNFCFQGKFRPEYFTAAELLINECRMMDCMKDEDLQKQFAHVIEEKPEIQELFKVSRDDLVNKKKPSEEFWDHFYGESEALAQIENLDTNTYIAAVNAGFGDEKQIDATPSQVASTNNTKVDKSVAENMAHIERSISDVSNETYDSQDEFQPTFSAGTDDPQLEMLDRELQINSELKESLDKMTKFNEILANSAAGSEKRDRAFQELGRAQEQVNGLRRQFNELKNREKEAGIVSGETFEERFSETFASAPLGPNIFGTRGNAQDSASRDRYDFSSNKDGQVTNSNLQAGKVNARGNGDRTSARRGDSPRAVTNSNAQDARLGLPKVDSSNSVTGNSTILTEQFTTGRGPSSIGSSSSEPVNLKGKDLVLANNLAQEPIAKSELKLEGSYQAEVIVDPKRQDIDLLDELLNYKKSHPEFQLGHVLTIKQLDENIGTYKKTRLIPTFASDGSFSGYGIAADQNMRSQLIVREFDKIKFRDLSRNEAYQLEMEIIVAQKNLELNENS